MTFAGVISRAEWTKLGAEQRQHSDLAFHSADYISRRTALGVIVLSRTVRKKKRTWRVIRLPATFIGLVEAPDEQTALKVAIEQFKISPGDQWRLVVMLCWPPDC
jgi:hypothetical protein